MHSEIVILEGHVTSLAPEPSMQQLPLPGREAQRQGLKGNAQVEAPAAVCNVGGAHQPRGAPGLKPPSITCASAADTPRTPTHRRSSRAEVQRVCLLFCDKEKYVDSRHTQILAAKQCAV